MVGQNVANVNSIIGSYREEGRVKTKNCQWHYLHNATHQSKQSPAENREPFMKLVQDLCKLSTVSLYIEKLEVMVQLCGNNDQVKNWINWWNIRKCNVFPASRGLRHSKMNLAETGYSSYQQDY